MTKAYQLPDCLHFAGLMGHKFILTQEYQGDERISIRLHPHQRHGS